MDLNETMHATPMSAINHKNNVINKNKLLVHCAPLETRGAVKADRKWKCKQIYINLEGLYWREKFLEIFRAHNPIKHRIPLPLSSVSNMFYSTATINFDLLTAILTSSHFAISHFAVSHFAISYCAISRFLGLGLGVTVRVSISVRG